MFGRTLIGAVSLAALAITLTPLHRAAAQLVPVDPSNSVLIDLGAIDGGRGAPVVGGSRTGVGSGLLGTMPGGSGQLLLPPQSTPSSRLLTPEGRTATVRDPQAETMPEAMPERAPRRAAAAPQPKAPAQPKMAAAPAQPKAAPAAQPKAAPALPQIALPSVPAPAAPSMAAPRTPAPSRSDSGPLALNATPTPPPSVTPPPDIPAMTVVGPQASLLAPIPAAPKTTAAPPAANKANTPPAAKSGSPTPPPAIAAPKAPDAPSAAAPTAPSVAAPSTPAQAPQQQAALPPATKGPSPAPAATADSLEIRFAMGDANLTNEAKAALDKLSDGLKNNEKSRLQLLAYASEDQISPSKARRLSLSRALAVRSHLIAKGIRSTRIDVRALGDQIPGGEPNRVDLKVTDR